MKTITKVKIAKLIFNLLIFFGFKKKNIVKRNSIKWKLDISEGIDLSIFLFGTFQKGVVESINKYIFKNKNSNNTFFNIIDIGSNIGDKSLSLAQSLLSKNFNEFKIFSIEPTDFAFKKQINNIKLNYNLKNKINSFKYFISNEKIKPNNIYSSWSLNTKKKTHKVHKGVLKKVNKLTSIVTLDDFIKKNKIKEKIIMKIDVDGFEMDVLKSSIKTLRNMRPVIFMEYAPYLFYENGFSPKEFFNFLKKYNYRIYDLNLNRLNKIKINNRTSTDIILICSK